MFVAPDDDAVAFLATRYRIDEITEDRVSYTVFSSGKENVKSYINPTEERVGYWLFHPDDLTEDQRTALVDKHGDLDSWQRRKWKLLKEWYDRANEKSSNI